MTKITTHLSLRRLAVAAAIGLVACSGPGDTPRGENAPTPGAAEAPETNAKEVATSFLEAYGAFDADRAITYLADDADLSGLGVAGNRQFGLLVSFLEAQGYKQMLAPCEQTGSSSAGTYVRCEFDFHAIRSDEIGRGPYSGSYFDLTSVTDRSFEYRTTLRPRSSLLRCGSPSPNGCPRPTRRTPR